MDGILCEGLPSADDQVTTLAVDEGFYQCGVAAVVALFVGLQVIEDEDSGH